MNHDPEDFHRIRDKEAFQKSLLQWLLQEPITKASLPTEDSSSEPSGTISEVNHLGFAQLDPLDMEGLIDLDQSQLPPQDFGETHNLGEIPAVQERFCAIIKRRLQTEIQHHPPLFPWETEILDYEPELSDASAKTMVPDRLWLNQLRQLKLPVPVPETVLTQLLERCQSVVQSSLLEGAKLVRVVECLFPNQLVDLNHFANLVLRAESTAYREPRELGKIAFLESPTDFPHTYEAALPVQQMVLSLLAAREILGSLTLKVCRSQPRVERQWLTEVGLLTLVVEYQETKHFTSLQVQGYLPCAGRLQMTGNQAQAIANRTSMGYLRVELFDLLPNQPYPLEVSFQSGEQKPLVFSVYTTND